MRESVEVGSDAPPRSLNRKIWSGGLEATRTAFRFAEPGVATGLKSVAVPDLTHKPALSPWRTHTHNRSGRAPAPAVHNTSVHSSVSELNGAPATRTQSTSTPGALGRWNRPFEVAATTVVPSGPIAMRLTPEPIRFFASRRHGFALAAATAGPWANRIPMPPSDMPGWALRGRSTRWEAASPVPTNTSSSASVAPKTTWMVPHEFRCAGRFTSGAFVGAKPPSDFQWAPPSLEYQ